MEDRVTDKPVPPWELPGNFRLDCEPHRGSLLGLLSKTAGFTAFFCVCWPFFVPVVVALGLWARALALNDLSQMLSGRRDPAGAVKTKEAQQIAELAVRMACVAGCVWAGQFLLAGACIRPARPW